MENTEKQAIPFLSLAKQGKNDWWHYLATFVLLLTAIVIGNVPLLILAFKKGNTDMAKWGLDTNLLFFLSVLTFAIALFGLLMAVKYVHQRAISTLIHHDGMRWKQFFWGAGVWLLLTIFIELINYLLHPEGYEIVFQPLPFFIGLIIALLMIPLQTSFEELSIRGWLMQSIRVLRFAVFSPFILLYFIFSAEYVTAAVVALVFAAIHFSEIDIKLRTKPWFPILLTSCLFGSLHLANPEVAHYGIAKMMAYYISFALFLGTITVLSNGLELALGIHAINNLYGSLVITFGSSALQTNTILRSPDPDINLTLSLSTIAMIVCFLIFQNKFNFSAINNLWKDEE